MCTLWQLPASSPGASIQSVFWEAVESNGAVPAPRSGHSFTKVGSRFLLFGGTGCAPGHAAQAFNDLYEFEPSDGEAKWSAVAVANAPPPPRACHAAFALDHDNLLIYGGVDKRTRFGDLWRYHCPTKLWTAVAADGHVDTDDDGEQRTIMPGARAHFTATKSGDRIFVFGGYGGAGIVYGELWVLHVTAAGNGEFAFRWELVEPEGKRPEPRMDHSVFVYPTQPNSDAFEKLVIMGGRDIQQSFDDAYMLELSDDLSALRWNDTIEAPRLDHAVCNNCCDSLESVPYWKVFSFGGRRGPMEYSNEIHVLDAGIQEWFAPALVAHPSSERATEPPVARDSAAWIYDSRRASIFLFGGWSSRWLGDTWRLHAAAVLGPPYAAMSVSPTIGPVFGSTRIEITGLRFREGSIQVRFAAGKNEQIADGEFVDSTRIAVATPNFEAFGPQSVDVTVQISGEGWTVQKQTFTYFANTHGRNCLAYGPGLLAVGVAGISMPFHVQARDTAGARRASGGDRFSLKVVLRDRADVMGTGSIADNGDGSYEAVYSVPLPGQYDVHVTHKDLGTETPTHVRGSPFAVECRDVWRRPRTLGVLPLKRKAASFVPLGSDLVLFGGEKGAAATSVLSVQGEDWRWTPLAVAEGEPSPAPRALHGAAALTPDTLAVFAGQSLLDGAELSDLWVLLRSADGWSWKGGAENAPFARELKRLKALEEERLPEARPVPAGAMHFEVTDVADGMAAWLDGHKWVAGGSHTLELKGVEEDAVAEVRFFVNADPNAEGAEATHIAVEAPYFVGIELAHGPRKWAFEAGNVTVHAVCMPRVPEDEGGEIVRVTEHAVVLSGAPAPAAAEAPPVERTLPMLVACGDCVVAFGGDVAGEATGEIAVADVSDLAADTALTWVEPTVWSGPDSVPSARKGMAGIRKGTKLILFSGHVPGQGGEYAASDELFIATCNDGVRSLTFERAEAACGPRPPARAGAIFQDYGTDKVALMGGFALDGAPFNDVWVLDTVKLVWSCVFNGHSELALPTGALMCLHEGRLIALNAAAGSPKLDSAAELPFVDVAKSYDFVTMMRTEASGLLVELQGWVDQQERGLRHPADQLSSSFSKLLETMAALNAVREAKNSKELLIDQLRELFIELAASKVNTKKSLEELEKVRERLEEVKKSAPLVKEVVAPVQANEGQRIRNEIQAFTDTVNAYARDFRKLSFLLYATGPGASYAAIDHEAKQLAAFGDELRRHTALASTFDFASAVTEAANRLRDVLAELAMAKDVWDTVLLCETQFAQWKKTLWADINTEAMEDASKAFLKEVRAIHKQIRDEDCYKGLDGMVKAFTTSLPLVAELKSPAMRERHWAALMSATGKRIALEDPAFSLQHLLDLELHKFEEEVGEIVDQAQKEEKMEVALLKLNEVWAKMEFQFIQHKTTDVYTIKMAEEDFEALEDNQVLVQGMLANRFCATFAEPDSIGCRADGLRGVTPGVTGWNRSLNAVADVYALMGEIQRTWAYLESLFIHSDEVKKELPEATKRFEKIDVAVKEFLKGFKEAKNCVAACSRDGLFKALEAQQGELEVCEKALAEFKESKRRAFPRFYFVSSNDLLDILSNVRSAPVVHAASEARASATCKEVPRWLSAAQVEIDTPANAAAVLLSVDRKRAGKSCAGNNPKHVMTHLSKVFQAIDRLLLDEPGGGGRPSGRGVVSCVGVETCDWSSPLTLAGKVEEYMNSIIDKMRGELKIVLFESFKAYPAKPRTDWLFDWPSQVILVVNQIFWCQEVEEAFRKMKGHKGAMREYNAQQIQQLTDLIQVTRTDLKKPDRQKVMNMITIDAHSRDMIEQIAESGSDDAEGFQWVCQLRTYWDASIDDCRIRICDAAFPYGYEYLGNGPRLVITPLTDRIYITATQACWLCLGTAPAGPAGTGKTETTKDLSAQLGKSIYVFNCAPEMDYRTMGDIFKGLAASGSWGCFDEFNRLVPEVLSVCSVQYKCVTDSQKRKSLLPGRGLDYTDASGKAVPAITDWRFVTADGVEMPLEEGTSAFITMNPGYIGRAELPESLKALFRPITVVVPDRQLIMENMLMAEGFETAKMLAKKFAALYYLLEDLLSPQKHYDWGLRAIKSVLVVAGSLLRAEAGQDEADVLFRALRDFNIPKILLQDMIIFMGLLNDLFPGTDPPRKRDMAFEKVIVDEAVKSGLTPEDDFILRVVQFSELMAIRHCVFLMGPTGAGRTEVYRTLAKALMTGTDAPVNDYLKMVNRQNILIKDINPKAVSTQELYGYVNMATREWKDGLLSFYMRELANIPDENPKWILLDGDLDANWIESMNSVMDDNKLLTLPSNERIRLLPHMKLVFEIRDLKFATPATATRAGILYISEGEQWNNMVQSWVSRVMPQYAAKAKWKEPDAPTSWMRDLVAKYCPGTVFEMKKSFDHITPLNTMNFVTTLTNILEGCLMLDNSVTNKADQATFEMLFVFAVAWAFGGGLNEKDGINYRRNFDKWFKQTFTTIKWPGKGTVYDYYVNFKTGKFAPWSELVADAAFDSRSMSMGSVFISTPETASLRYFLDMMVALKKPVMFVGGAGVGKTQLVAGKLATLSEDQLNLGISFNYFTDVTTFQKILESPLEKKAGVKYGPPGTKQLIYFIDDLNMPKLDPYDTAMPISLVRQHLGWGHWYDRAKLSVKEVGNTQYIAAMNPTAGSFTINPRLQRLFMTLSMDFPGQDSLMKIYGTFLEGHLKHFKPEVQELKTRMLQATLNLYDQVASTFRKTAVNFHYEFTIRHLANFFQGLLMSEPDKFNDTTKLARLWLHESERVYADRLVTAADLDSYNKKAVAIAKKFFSIPDVDDYYKKMEPKPLIFCHFAGGLGDKVYDEVHDYSSLYKTLTDALDEYNETNATMDLVLFEDAMKHVCRIARIISNPSGHALLVGVGGSGKQSLARLAAHICGFSTMMIVISGSYSLNNFKEDLQAMYRRAGMKGEGTMFLFTDSQVVDERMLVFINDLLASGEIPDLFPAEERDDIINAMRSETKAAGLVDSNDNCWATFINKVKENLHMVFTASPVGDNFRIRSQRFLATVNSTVIDWFQPWPESSLLSVAERFLKSVDLGDDAVRKGVVEFMPHSFREVNKASEKFKKVEGRYNYTTPKTFLELIKLYTNVLARKREATMDNIDRLETGLTKLHKTQKDVDVLVEAAKRMAVQVQEKVVSADAFAEKVGAEKVKVNAENEAAQIEKAKCEQIAVEVTEKQTSCEADLAAALPLVEQAEAALDTLNKKDLGEAKSLKKPPAGVDDITAVVIILLENNPKDKSWAAAQKLMGNVDKFMERLKTFKDIIDGGGIQKKVVDATRSYLELPHFNRDTIMNKSKAAAGLCDWAVNIVKYFDVVYDVAPKKAELAEANAKLEDANTTLKAVMEKVAELNAMVADLEEQFAAANKEKEDAIAEQERCDRKLGLANRLITALASEGERWALTVEQLKGGYEVLTGDMLLAAAFVSYAGPFTSEFRASLVASFLDFMRQNGTPMTQGLKDPLKVLVDEAMVASWVKEGLPSDPTSVQNGAILCNSERWPLLMDPQLQGIVWIKERESRNDLKVIRMEDDKKVGIMERAIEAGASVLIENMGESIDAVLSPVITRSTFKKGRSLYVKLGDKEVEYSSKFRLVLHTKLSNPHYPPEIQAETTLINFTVTESGLEDQLLALTVNKERPDLETTKTQLVAQNTEFTIRLKQLEDDLLMRLSTAEGDLTEDVELIESLEESKRVADDINLKVAEAKETEKAIMVARNRYRGVAARGAMLFFLLNALNKIHAFYQFSLNAFVIVFGRGIANTPGGRSEAEAATARGDVDGEPEPDEGSTDTGAGASGEPDYSMSEEDLVARLAALTDCTTFTVFDFTRRGLFDRDKLTVTCLLTFRILLRDGMIDAAEFAALQEGAKNPNPPPAPNDLSRWLSEGQWAALSALCGSVGAFASFAKEMEKNSDDWEKWAGHVAPEKARMPGEWGKVLSSRDAELKRKFRELLVTRAMRPDRITNALTAFCEFALGARYTNQPAFACETMMPESTFQTPIFFILFPGYSPSKEVEAYANSVGYSIDKGNLTLISMGQGQDKPAEATLDKYMAEGGWVFLDNVHLMQGWVPRLERKLEIASESAHKDFRCFFSAEPINGAPFAKIVPEAILQISIKVANEPPSDMKSNMRRAFAAFPHDLEGLLESDKKRSCFRSILFGLCFYHSLLLGRKKFGVGIGVGSGSGLGFCRGYSFNMGDLTTCGDVLINYLNSYADVPWPELRYMFGEVFYGGHITDNMDRRCCTTYLDVLIIPDLLPQGSIEDAASWEQPAIELSPGFHPPVPTDMDAISAYIESSLPAESPIVYGMHSNAELSLLTAEGETLFKTMFNVSGGGGGGGGGGDGDRVRVELERFMEALPAQFNMVDIESRVKEKTPFVVVALQETGRMNALLAEMKKSMDELTLGLDGSLNMSPTMEALASGIRANSVPARWMAMMSSRIQEVLPLSAWFADVVARRTQLEAWTAGAVVTPLCVWLPGLFNAKAFVTAVMQTYARENSLPLDVMKFVTEVTPMMAPEEVTEEGGDSRYIHGCVLEGARWDSEEGSLVESAPNELHQHLPVMEVKPVHSDDYSLDGYYACPVYVNMQRANVYSAIVSMFTLRSNVAPSKWVLASVAILLQDELA